MVGGVVKHEFGWRNGHFPKGAWVLLDLYATNHDPRAWEHADSFKPERFGASPRNEFAFIPQGGGSYEEGHRCAGEWITIELMKLGVRMLTRAMRYDVPTQDLRIDPSRMPAIPASRFLIRSVKETEKAFVT